MKARLDAPRRRRWWPALLVLAVTLGAVLLALPYAIETPWLREQLRVGVNRALGPLFLGRIEIDRIGHVGLWGVRGVDARIFDAQGQRVIRVQGLTALAWLPGLAWQLVAHGDAPELSIALVDIDHADVQLREDEELGVTIARAFLPREEEEEATPPEPPGADPHLHIESVRIRRVWAHGRVAGSPALDADLLELRARLSQSSAQGFVLDLDGAKLVTRGMPWALDPRGEVLGRIEVPQDEPRPMRLEATFDGRAADAPLSLEATWVGDALFARLSLAGLPAERLNAQFPQLALSGDVSVTASIDGDLPALDFTADIDAAAAHVRASGSALVSGGLELMANVEAARVDLSGIARGAPPSDLSLRLSALVFEREAGTFIAGGRVDVAPGVLATLSTPSAWLTSKGELSESGALGSGKLGIDEPGAPINGDYRIALPEQGRAQLSASLRSQLDAPPRLSAWGVRTTGALTLAGDFEPESGRLAAKSELSLSHLDYRELGARNVEVRARLSGTLEAPRVHAATTLDLLSGRAHADLDYAPEATALSLFAAELDLVRLAQAFGLPAPLRQGTLSLDVGLRRQAPSPHFTLDGSARADFGKVGVVRARATDFQLASSALALSRLDSLRGDVTLNGNVDLSQLEPALIGGQLPIERVTGKVRFEVQARHRPEDADGLELAASIETAGLRIVQQRADPTQFETTADALADSPLALEGIDLRLSLHARPRRGIAVGTLILRDPGGTLAELQAEAGIAGLWPSGLIDVERLAHMPLKVLLQVPERRLGSLPPLLRPPVLRGRLTLDAELEGSIAEPNVTALVTLRGLRASGSKDPLDVESKLGYTPAQGRVEALAKVARSGAEVLDLKASWQGDLLRAARATSGAPPLTGSATVKLAELPLDVVPELVDRQLGGRLSGELKLQDWGRDARIDAQLHSNSLSIGKLVIERLEASAKSDARTLSAKLELAAAGGTTSASLDASMRWGERALPVLERQGVAKLSTRAFRLDALSPFIGAYVSELGGLLDASTELSVTPTTTTLKGEARLRRGVLQIPAIGQRFSDIEARVDVRDNQFQLEQLEARGTTGKLRVTGSARLDGFELRSAEARATIGEREKLPITLEGQVLGDAWGNLAVRFDNPRQGARRVSVDVPELHLLAPENAGSGLQSLDDAKDIRVGVRRADGKFVPLAVQPLEPGGKVTAGSEPVRPMVVEIALGNVTVERGRSVQAQLTGKLTLHSAVTTELTGRIEVRGGKLDVQGKTFEIERGVITFDGAEPGNPTVTATARWDAPDYTVYADYVGDVETGRIKLRAEPPLTQDQIASLLLFGSPEGSAGGSDPNAASLAVSVAGDTAAQGLNQALDDLTNLDVSARIDTTTGSARPELVFQVSPRVAAKVTRAIGSPAAGESPDRTFLTLELRLKRAWALSALIGDRGASALDLIWRRRY